MLRIKILYWKFGKWLHERQLRKLDKKLSALSEKITYNYLATLTCEYDDCGYTGQRVMRDSPAQLVSECPSCSRTTHHWKNRMEGI